jgi:hypothetical protein
MNVRFWWVNSSHLVIEEWAQVHACKRQMKDSFLLDTHTTLRGGVNECGDLFPKTSLLHKNSLVNIQHLIITH